MTYYYRSSNISTAKMFCTKKSYNPLFSEAYADTAPWFNSAGVVPIATEFTVSNLPMTATELRNPKEWKKLPNAVIQGGNQRYEVHYQHISDGEAAGQVPHISVAQDGQTILEIALQKGEMKVFKGRDFQTQMAKLDMDMGFFSNTYKVINEGSKKACMSIKSKGLGKDKNEVKFDGRVLATQTSRTQIRIETGVDAIKVITMFLLQWWNHVNEKMVGCDGVIVPGLV